MVAIEDLPRLELRNSLQRLAAAIAPTSYAIAGLVIALFIGGRGDGTTHPHDADAMLRPFVKSGDVYRFDSRAATQADKTASLAPIPIDTAERSIELKIAVEGEVEKSAAARLSDSLFVVHVFEMAVQATSERIRDGSFVYQLFFERARDVSLNAPHPLPAVDLERAMKGLPTVGGPWHVGQRRESPFAISQAVFGQDVLRAAHRTSSGRPSRAFWSVSSLEGKTVRLMAPDSGMTNALQPLGCDLSKNETDWLRRSLLPQWVHGLASGNSHEGPELSANTLSRIIPPDLSFVGKIGSPVMAAPPMRLTPESVMAVWQADLDMFTELYPPSVFMEPEYAASSPPRVTMTLNTSKWRE